MKRWPARLNPFSRDPGHRRPVPTVLQMEAVECGAAALAMVLGHYRKYVTLEELRTACGVSRNGSKASNIVRAARAYGLEAKGYRKEPEQLPEMPLPAIVFWNFNHFVVLEGFGENKVYLNDPAFGPRVVSTEEFDQAFTGVVLTFTPAADFEPSGQKPSLLRSLSERLGGTRTALLYLVLTGIALVIPGMVIPVFTSVFIDNILVGGMQDWVRPLLIGMAATLLLTGALTWLQQYYLLRLEARIAISTSARFFWHVLRLPINFYTQRSAGDIGSRVGISNEVAMLLSGDLANALLSLFSALFFVIILLFYDVTMTLISVAVVIANILLLRRVATHRKTLNQRLAADEGKVIGTSMNGLLLIETLKASGSESDFFSRWAGYQAKLMNSMQQMARSSSLLSLAPELLTGINSALILGIGGGRVINGDMTMGTLVAFQALIAMFMNPVNDLVALGSKVQEMQGNMDRLDDVMRHPVDKVEHADASEDDAPRERLQGYLELRNVTFGYNPQEPPLIEDFSLSLKPGQRVALIGASGCGKSTVSKLVMGLYEPWSGEVLFDGRPRREHTAAVLSHSLAMVDQDIAMFSGSLRDNLTLWDEAVPESDLVQAARDACIHEAIAQRPGGYDSEVQQSGSNFSGGQRQRLEIARALVNRPRVLVLDEATSALDPVTEKTVDDNLRRRGCTCLIVAHRLSTMRDCDEIILLDQGKVIERGTHDALMALDGHYVKLIGNE